MKRAVAILICMILTLGIFGCGSKAPAGDTTSDGTDKGAYIEQTITLPKSEGGDEQVIVGLQGIENGVEVFAMAFSMKDDGSVSSKYYSHKILNDGTTTSEQIDSIGEVDAMVPQFSRSDSGSIYILAQSFDENMNPTFDLSVSEEGSKAVSLTGDYMTGSQTISRIGFLSNGDIVCLDGATSKVQILDKDGNLKETLEEDANRYQSTLAVKNNMIAYLSADEKSVITFDTSSKETKKIEYASEDADSAQITFKQLAYGSDETLYLCDQSGIYSRTKDGNLWERIVEGSSTTLGMPDFYADKFVVGAGDHPSVYISDNAGKLFKYAYDENASVGKKEQISVFSLRENEFVRQAVVEFNRQNPNVNVTYNIAMSMETGGTEKDYINALNSELLAGAGPDILILDGLPLESYVQKGVLADLKKILEESEEILPNILKASTSSDGNIYAIPSGIRLPVAHIKGDQAGVFDSLQSLADACEASTEKPLLGNAAFSYRSLSQILLKYYGKDLLQNSSEIASAFLSNADRISKAIGAGSTLASDNSGSSNYSQEELEGYLNADNTQPQLYDEVMDKVQGALFQPMNSLAGGMFITGAAEQFGYKIVGINAQFEAAGIIGINRASKHTSEAGEFLKLLLSKSIQSSIEFPSQFPVNKEALENQISSDENKMSMGAFLNDEVTFNADWPNKESRTTVYELLTSATTEILSDKVLIDMLVPMIAAYLDGTDTIDATIGKIDSVISTYLSE